MQETILSSSFIQKDYTRLRSNNANSSTFRLSARINHNTKRHKNPIAQKRETQNTSTQPTFIFFFFSFFFFSFGDGRNPWKFERGWKARRETAAISYFDSLVHGWLPVASFIKKFPSLTNGARVSSDDKQCLAIVYAGYRFVEPSSSLLRQPRISCIFKAWNTPSPLPPRGEGTMCTRVHTRSSVGAFFRKAETVSTLHRPAIFASRDIDSERTSERTR